MTLGKRYSGDAFGIEDMWVFGSGGYLPLFTSTRPGQAGKGSKTEELRRVERLFCARESHSYG